MPATIEHLPPKWTSDAAKQAYDMLMAEINRAFVPPRPAADSWTPQQFADFKRHAIDSTAWLLEQCVRLNAEFTQPVIRINVSAGA